MTAISRIDPQEGQIHRGIMNTVNYFEFLLHLESPMCLMLRRQTSRWFAEVFFLFYSGYFDVLSFDVL